MVDTAPQPLHVLILEDNPNDADLMLRALRRGGFEPTWERVDTEAAFAQQLAGGQYDILLSDYSLPTFSALGALRWLQAHQVDIPVIIVSGTIGEDDAVAALHLGATDFLLKDRLARLAPAVRYALQQRQLQREKDQAEAALRHSEERFSKAFHNSPMATCLTARDGTFLNVNASFLNLLGYTRAELIGRTSHELRIWVDPQQRAELAQTLRAQGQVRDVEAAFRTKSGAVRVALASAVYVELDDGPCVLTHLHDISDRIQVEAQALRQLEQLRGLRAIDIAIGAGLDVRLALTVLLEQVVTLLDVHAADVLLLDAATHRLEFTTGRGFRSNFDQRDRVRLGEGRVGQVALERRVIQLLDLGQEPPISALGLLAAAEGFVGYIGVPLIVKGQVKGVLEVFHRAPLRPDPDWLEFLETLAGQAAIAIDNAGLFEELQQSHSRLALAYDATIEGWSAALDLRDKETEGHSQRVTEMSLALAQRLGLSSRELRYLRWGALLHDIGKMGVPDAILFKPAPLNDEEWVIMRQHPQHAYAMLSPIAYLRPALDVPYCHHERWDGSGYPRGLSGEQIPLAARIFSVVDVWDALRSDRPYRPAWTTQQAREYIQSMTGRHFDPAVVSVFLEMI